MTASRDQTRLTRLARAITERGLDGVVLARPSNVLMATGYWPVLGTALAIVTREGRVGLVAPEDERILADDRADEARWFASGSLEHMKTALEVATDALRSVAERLGLTRARIGYEGEAAIEPASYAASERYDARMRDALTGVLSPLSLLPVDDLLTSLRAALTPREIERVRAACRVVARAFEEGFRRVVAGAHESAVAAAFRSPLAVPGAGEVATRADGHVACVSGPRGASAHGAYAMSTARELRRGDLVLVHCNSTVDGYWTDVTRTYSLGALDDRKRAMFDAVFEARDAALAAVRPGVVGADVDAAARGVLARRGFGAAFKHPTGHGVGFAAIDHLALPRLHPRSDDVLEVGMVMNVEPAIYLDDCGLRHCDVVLCTEGGAEVLTPFQSRPDDLIAGVS